MATRAAEELLFDSETTLRLVDNVLDELQVMEAEVSRSEDKVRSLSAHMGRAHAGVADLPQILLRARDEIQNVLDSLKQSRDVLERSTVDKVHHMNDRLREVTSATEVAATDILDGLDRSLALIDRLDGDEPTPDTLRGEIHGALRNEIFGVMGCLQFQDITAQQLTYASSVLEDMETRLTHLAGIFDPSALGGEVVASKIPPSPLAADPSATTRDAESRQALVDEIFQVGGDGK